MKQAIIDASWGISWSLLSYMALFDCLNFEGKYYCGSVTPTGLPGTHPKQPAARCGVEAGNNRCHLGHLSWSLLLYAALFNLEGRYFCGRSVTHLRFFPGTHHPKGPVARHGVAAGGNIVVAGAGIWAAQVPHGSRPLKEQLPSEKTVVGSFPVGRQQAYMWKALHKHAQFSFIPIWTFSSIGAYRVFLLSNGWPRRIYNKSIGLRSGLHFQSHSVHFQSHSVQIQSKHFLVLNTIH